MTGTVRTIRGVCGIIADMVRVLTGVAAWLAGTALAVGLAWFGAGLVVRSTGMTPSAPAIVSAGPLRSPAAAPARPPASPARSTGPRGAVSRSPSPSAPGSAAPSRPAPANGTLHGYTLAGGHVTLLLTQTAAKLVSAVPGDGYSVQTWSGAGWLRVDFSSGAQVSSLIASWNGHAPSVTVTN
jgi:hypothetical protein